MIHQLQKRDASQRLEISKLKGKITSLNELNQQLQTKIQDQEDRIKRDNEYILQLDNQVSKLKDKF